MDILAAYREVGSDRGTVMCGTTHKTAVRIEQQRHDVKVQARHQGHVDR